VSYLQSIAAFTGGNMGSILEIQVARAADIVSMPAPVGGVVYGDIEFEEGTGFFPWTVTHETAGISRDGKTSREGFSKNNRLPFKIPKGRSTIGAMLEQAAEDELIVLFKENGKQKIFGSKEAPVKLSYSHKTGEAIADTNHYACLFYYEGPDNVFEYEGDIELSPSGVVPALVKYNGTTIAALLPGEVLNITSEFGFTDFYISSIV
jgi:hypothetical protein